MNIQIQLNPSIIPILPPSLNKWVAGKNGSLPPNAHIAGREATGAPLYIAHANYAGGVHVGKIGRDWQSALIPYGGKEIPVNEYEVYTGIGVWIAVSGGAIPSNAIAAGREADGRQLFVARASYQGGVHIGKTRADWNFAAIPYGGREINLPQYEVLVTALTLDEAGTATKDGVTTTVSRTPSTPNVSKGETQETRYENSGRICTSRQVEMTSSNLETIVSKGISDLVYPGAIFNLNSVADGSFQTYNVARTPMELAISLISGTSGSLRSTVGRSSPASINYGTVGEAVRDLLQRNANVNNAADTFSSIEIVRAEEQLRVAAQVDFSGWGVDVGLRFGYSKETKREFVLMKLTQVYFTVIVNTDDPKTLLADHNLAINGDPVYVSSVRYGRIGYLRVESSESAETISAALNFKYSGTATVEGRVAFERMTSSKDLKIDALFLGGDAELAASTINGTNVQQRIDKFIEYINKGAIYGKNVAVQPISYRMKFLKDNRIAHTSMITSFAEQNCRTAQYLKVRLCGISVDNHSEGVWGYVDLEVWELDSQGNLVRQVFPKRQGNMTRMWQRPKENRLPSGPYPLGQDRQEQEITNVGVEWEFWIDPRKMSNNQILLVTRCKLEAEHKDNSFAATGWHGMRNEERREVRLQDFLNSGKSFLLAGPYDSNTDRWHAYRAQFKLSAGN